MTAFETSCVSYFILFNDIAEETLLTMRNFFNSKRFYGQIFMCIYSKCGFLCNPEGTQIK